jgi:tryptophan synthase beta chain
VDDAAALEAFRLCTRLEGIIPALESAHALAHLATLAPGLAKDNLVVVNLSGRGDKDVNSVATALGVEL